MRQAPPFHFVHSLLYGIFIPLLVFCSTAGCARTQMQQIAPKLSNMVIVRHYFGEPTRSERLADGSIRHEWVLDRVFQHAGGSQTQKIYVGHDSDGYREYREVDVDVLPWKERQYCRMQAIADTEGRVLDVFWEGTHCDELPRVKVPVY